MDDVVLKVSIIVLTILVGLMVGSFLNVVIYRLPNDMSLVKPGSHCPKCNNPIKWYDNIPLLSYIFLGGKCRHCKEKISIRYPTVELFNSVLWFLSLLVFTNLIIPTNNCNWIMFGVSCVACSAFLCMFFTDYDYMVIPDALQLVVLICGLVSLMDNPTMENIMLKVFGFLGAGLLFLIVNGVYKLIKKKDGIGFGDIELVAVAGLLLGGYKMIYALLLSCVVGGIVLIILSFINKDRNNEYPFAVMLTSGFVIALFTGDLVVNWYLALIGVR